MKRSLSDRDHKRLEAMIRATRPRNGEALEYAKVFGVPVATMARVVVDIRGRVA